MEREAYIDTIPHRMRLQLRYWIKVVSRIKGSDMPQWQKINHLLSEKLFVDHFLERALKSRRQYSRFLQQINFRSPPHFCESFPLKTNIKYSSNSIALLSLFRERLLTCWLTSQQKEQTLSQEEHPFPHAMSRLHKTFPLAMFGAKLVSWEVCRQIKLYTNCQHSWN